MSAPPPNPGCMFLVVGPSGAGKDTLIGIARERFAGQSHLRFARRIITRPADAGGEDHIAVDEDVFHEMVTDNAFALHWRAHGFRYGIPAGVGDDLGHGINVVANVSRTVIGQARDMFSKCVVLSIHVRPDALVSRLRARGRESGEGLAARVARAGMLRPEGVDVIHIDNSDDLQMAGKQFVDAIEEHGTAPANPQPACG